MGTSPTDWLSLAWAVFALLIASFAVKQMSFVIVNGSIFDWIRYGFKRGMRDGVFGAETLHALFTCTLCMTTQLSLWLVGLPTFLIVLTLGHTLGLPLAQSQLPWNVVVAIAYAGFLAFGVGGLATIFMTATEYPPSRFRKLYDAHQELQNRFNILESMASGAPIKVSGLQISVADFVSMFDAIDTRCQGIHCPFRRADCFIDTYASVIEQWVAEQNLTKAQKNLLLGTFGALVADYLAGWWDFDGDPPRRAAFVQELYQKLNTGAAVAA